MKNNIILNIDWFTAVAPFLDEVMKSGYVTKEALYPFVDQYIDLASGEKSQIGAIAFNVFSQIAYVKSNCITDYTIIENGKSNCDEEIVKWCRAFCDMNGKYNIEPWGVWIKRCRERGLEAWVSVRMNDTHDECPEEVRIMREKYALGDHEKYGRCMNYAYPEVRNQLLGHIGELLEMFDFDVLELDFLREITCVDYENDPNATSIITEFMKTIKTMADNASKVKGHKIKISVRLLRDIEHNRVFGFDVDEWVRLGLVDHITISPRWASCDDLMPIKEWKERYPSLEIAAGTETLFKFFDLYNPETGSIHVDDDMINGLASYYLSEGADQFYLYNFFYYPQIMHTEYYNRSMGIVARCGDIETSATTKRRHAVMFEDLVPEGHTAYKPLPMTLCGEKKDVTVGTGIVPDGAKATICIGFEKGSPENTTVYVNGKKCEEFEKTTSSAMLQALTGSGVLSSAIYELKTIPNGAVKPGDVCYRSKINLSGAQNRSTVTLESNDAVITHIEIDIN